MIEFFKDHPVLTGLAVCTAGAAAFCYCRSKSSVESDGQGKETKEEVPVAVQDAVEDVSACFPADLLQAEKSSQCRELLVYQARSWELLLPSYKQVFPELHPRNLLKIFIKPRLLMPIVVFPVAAPWQAIVVFECPAPTVVLGEILYLMSAVTFAALICFVINFVMKMHIQSKVKSLQGRPLASITEVHQIQEENGAYPSIASTDRRESDALVTTEVNVQPSSSVKSIVTASSTGLKELRPFDLRASWDTQSLESLAVCASRQGRQVTLHPSLAEFLNTLMRPLSLELEQMEFPSSAKRPVLVTMHGRHAIIRHRVKVHLMDYCATEPDNMSTLISSVSQVSHDEHEWMVAEMSEHLKANTVSVTTLQLGLEGIGMDFIDTTARPLSVSVFGCLEGEAQVETKQNQACIMAIEDMFKPSSRVKQMVTELLCGFKKPYRPHICGSLKTQSAEGGRLASITEVHQFQEKTGACPSNASTDRQESDALVTTEVNVQPSSSVKSIVTASSTGLKELRPFALRASWDTQSLESLAACASRQGRQVTLHPSLAEFLNTLMRPLSLELEQMEPPSSAKRPVLVTMHGRHAIIRRRVKVHLLDYCATEPDNMSTLLSSVSQASHDEHEWMVAEMSERLKANTVSVTTLQLSLEGIGMGSIDTTARPLSVSVFGCLEGEAQVETKQDQTCIMAIEEMFKPSSRVKQMVTELLCGFKKPYRPHICGSLKTQSAEGRPLASITEVHQIQEETGACPSIASTDCQESDALVTTEVNVQPSSSVKSIVTASSTGLKELRPFDLRASWDTQSLESLAACVSRQGRQVTLHPSPAESLTTLMRPLSLELNQMEPPSSAKRPVLVTMHGRHAIIRRRVKVHLLDYCATEPDNMSTLLSSVSQVSYDEHEWMVAEMSEHLKANTISVTTRQLSLEGIGMGFIDTTARPLSVSVFGCLEGEAQVETKQDQACIMAIEDMFKPSSRVKQMVTELLSGFKKPYRPHICGSLKTLSVKGGRFASITEVHQFQEKTGACPSNASTDRQESDALVTTEVNVQPSSSVKSIVTASSTGLKELRPFDLRTSWDTQSLESLAACASRQGRQVTLHPSLAEFRDTLMRPLSLELKQMEPPSSAKRPVLVTMHGRHAIIRRRVKVHLLDYCATEPDNMSTLLSSVSQVSHDEHEWMVAEMSEHLKANTVSVTTLQLSLEGIGMAFIDRTARPLSVSVFGCLEGEAQVETKQDQACIMAIEDMFKPSSRVKQMVTELLSGFKKPYRLHICGSLKTQSAEGGRFASITEVHQFQEKTGACPSNASTDRQESDALVATEVNVQPSSSVKSIVTASSTGLKELRPFDLRASWDTQSLESLAACASRQGRQVRLHPSLAEFLNTLMRPLSLEFELIEPLSSSAERSVLVSFNGRYATIRRRVKVHLMDYCATEPDNMSTLLSSVSQVSHDEHEWMVAEMSEHLKANKLNVSTLQPNLERFGMGLMDMAYKICSLLKPGFGSGKEEARKEESEETKQYQACFISTEEMFSPVRQMVIDLPSGLMKPYLPGIRGSRKIHLIYDCATAPEHMAALPSSAIQLSQDDHQYLVAEKRSDCLDATPATDLARVDACFPAIAVPNPVSVPKSASFGEERQGENPNLKHHECCEEEPQCPITEPNGVTTLRTDFAGDLPDTPFPTPVYESKSSSLGEESKGEDTALEQHECCVKERKSFMSEMLPEDITDGVSIQYKQYLKKDEESSVEEPQLVIGGEEDRVPKNDNDANLATDAGVVHTPNDGVDRELPSDCTFPMSTNDGDTSKENQQLLHKCAQAQKKKAKRKNQRPKTSQRKSRTGKQECQKKENEPELSVIGKESILHNFSAEAIVEQDVVSAKQYPMTQSSDARRDEISHQAEERIPHKTPTASELAASITDAQEGKVKGINKLNVRTKQSKSKNTDAEAELLSVQGVKINLRESKNQNRKESKKGKHRNNHVDDYPRKGHACGVMGRPSTPSTTKRSSYATAAQKGNSTGRENHKESYQMNGMVQDGARSNNSLDSRDAKSSSRLLVKANMHQGDARLVIPGVQCCSIALCAILRASGKSPLLWTPEDMDDIILTGDRKHRETQERMNRSKTSFLHIDEIELDIKLRGRHFHLKRSDVMCGDIMNDGTDKNSPLPGIESSIETLSEYDMFIVRYLLYTIALFKTSQTWLLFDSHNRDQNGFRHPNGKAVLLEFKTLRSVACYIRRFVSSNGFSDETSPRPLDDSQLSYELAGIKVAVLS
ncbi:uncharacterized protein LOC116601875 isoform X2 [Nematostella vectensis]|uniref:uncharacterized protein LOC116601875 isoform X2 n=1 Tax=Nematostella vectensis TaxID=45351 RepID=UPI0020776042|nr:uncharacterized protein LOC116601875 isoform X2 [Nematostella vectensis]